MSGNFRVRLKQLAAEVEAKNADYEAGRMTKAAYKAFVTDAHAEMKSLEAVRAVAAKYAGAAEVDQGLGFSQEPGALVTPASPTMATAAQRQQLEHAIRAKMPCTLEIKSVSGWQGGIQSKAAIAETGFSPALPGVEIPTKYMSFPYEPTRLASYLPGAAMDRASAFWISETAHANEASTPGEGGTKPDLGPTLVNNQVTPTKIAALFSYTFEVEQDVPGGVSGFVLNSLQRSIINEENALLLNAVSGTSHATFNGWLSTSGTLSQDGTGLNGVDAIISAAAAMRSNSGSFAEPDLLVVSPNTVAAILKEKDNQGRYLNNVVYGGGPGGLTWNGDPASSLTTAQLAGGVSPQGHDGGSLKLAGVPVVQSTQIEDFKGLLLSIRNGGGVYWTRQNMFVAYDPYSGLASNTYRYVAEQRIALSVPRPAAVSVISNLAGTSA